MFKMRSDEEALPSIIWNISTSVSSISNSEFRSDEEALPSIHSNVLRGSHHVEDEEEEEESSNIWWPELF